MGLVVELEMDGSVPDVWNVCTDITHSADFIEAIIRIEIVEGAGFAEGLRWNETREMFGKAETEQMYIQSVDLYKNYVVGSISCGVKYESSLVFEKITESRTKLSFVFETKALSWMGWFFNCLIGCCMNGMLRKQIMNDLKDIAAEVEKRSILD